EDFLPFAHHLPVLEQTEFELLVAQKKVCCNRKMGAEHHFLVHGVDSVPDGFVWSGERNRFAFPIDFSTGAHMNAGKTLDKSRLTGSIFAHNRMDFTRFESKINSLKRMRSAETLVELFQHQNRSAGLRRARCRGAASLLRLIH